MSSCPNCGVGNAADARFCSGCGAALAGTPGPARVRKTVTLVFADVTGSTDLGERFDPEAIRGLLSRYFQEMRLAVERHGGVVEKFIGDAVMAVFGIPRVHEDDAHRAVRAAAEMRAALDRVNDEFEARWGVRLATRIGVNTGEVVTGDPSVGQTLVTGDAVNLAARLEQAAAPGEIIIGELTHRLVRDAIRAEAIAPLTVKGKAEPVAAHRLVEVIADAPVRRLRDTLLVGRDDELAQMMGCLRRVADGGGCELLTVLGPPGVGKSRLTAEFLSRVPPATTIVRARCLPYGEGITFWPVAEALRQVAAIIDDDPADVVRFKVAGLLGDDPDAPSIVDRLGQILGLGGVPVASHEIFWGVRRIVEALARPAGLVLLFEDIHWAEPTFLDLLEYLPGRLREAPVLIVCPARPELLETRASWGEGLPGSILRLGPLRAAAARHLVANLLGEAGGESAIGKRMVDAAEGNPLFLEELVGMLLDQGLLQRRSGSWTLAGDPSAVKMPATIQGILAARLDGLSQEERAVVGCASVVGRVFEHAAVAHLVPDQVRPEVDVHLDVLVLRELVRPESVTAYRFRHMLIRDAAYDGVTKEARADLHERFAGWLERSLGDRLGEVEEIVGYHLEQSYRYRTELGPIDAHARYLADRAAALLAEAGRRALARSDMPASSTLLGRSASLLSVDAPERPQLLLDQAFALTESGEFVSAEQTISEATESAARAGDERISARAVIERWRLEGMMDPDKATKTEDQAESLIRVLEQHGDDEGLAQIWKLLTEAHLMRIKVEPAEKAAARALEYARKVGDHRAELDVYLWIGVAMLVGPRSAPEGIERVRSMVTKAGNDNFAKGILLVFEASLEAMGGRFDVARRGCAVGRALVDDVGRTVHAAATSMHAARIELLAGEPIAAERILRPDYDLLMRLGERAFLASTASVLALALCGQGRFDEAESAAETSREAAANEDSEAQVDWRRAKGLVHRGRGKLEEAEALLREALHIVAESDHINQHGDTLMEFASILDALGRREESYRAVEKALGFYEQKSNLVSAAKAREVLTSSA